MSFFLNSLQFLRGYKESSEDFSVGFAEAITLKKTAHSQAEIRESLTRKTSAVVNRKRLLHQRQQPRVISYCTFQVYYMFMLMIGEIKTIELWSQILTYII